MKKLIAIAAVTLACANAHAFDIVAFGTSAINCRNVADRGRIFSVQLEKALRDKGYDAHVINAGVDGDRPIWMENRIKTVITPQTRIVIVEPGPNDTNKSSALESIHKVFGYLQSIAMPTVYASNRVVESEDEATETASKYGVTYYGNWKKGVPTTSDYFLFDTRLGQGHMSAEGCTLWAQNMVPTVEKIIVDNKIQ